MAAVVFNDHKRAGVALALYSSAYSRHFLCLRLNKVGRGLNDCVDDMRRPFLVNLLYSSYNDTWTGYQSARRLYFHSRYLRAPGPSSAALELIYSNGLCRVYWSRYHLVRLGLKISTRC